MWKEDEVCLSQRPLGYIQIVRLDIGGGPMGARQVARQTLKITYYAIIF